MVRLQRVHEIRLAGERGAWRTDGLDALAEAVLRDGSDNVLAVLLLCVHPTRRLIKSLRVHGTSKDLVHLNDRLRDRGARLLELRHELRVVKDAARNLAVATTQAEHQVEGGLLLDIVVGEGAAVLELLARKYQTLLIRWDALLVLDLGFHVVNRVRGLHLQRDRLASQRLDENLAWARGGLKPSCSGLM